MKELAEKILGYMDAGEDTMLAVITRSQGSTPRKAGAFMLVAEAGPAAGTVGGGSIEAHAVATAIELMKKGQSGSGHFTLTVDGKDSVNMVCGGEADLLFRYIPADSTIWREIAECMLECAEEHKTGYLVFNAYTGMNRDAYEDIDLPDIVAEPLVVSQDADPSAVAAEIPSASGQSILQICDEKDPGSTEPGGNVKAAVGTSGTAGILDTDGKLLAGTVTEVFGHEDFLSVGHGGSIIKGCFIMPLAVPERVVVFGGGYVAQSLVPVLAAAGFRCTVFENRPGFADKGHFPAAEQVILGDYTRIADFIKLRDDDYYVIMTHGHEHDYELQNQLLRRKFAYLGAMGSRRKIAVINAKLEAAGISPEVLKTVHTPIGLKIGAVTPAEIAVSVAAECILVRSELRKGSS